MACDGARDGGKRKRKGAWLASEPGARAAVRGAVLAILAAAACSPLAPRQRLLFEQRTPYNHIRVIEENDERSLWFDNALQGSMRTNDPLSGFLDYVDYFHCAWLFNDRVERVLFIGLGTGMGPKAFLHDYPTVRVDAVDIDPAIPQVAERFFGLLPQPRLQVHIADGATYVRETPHRYDVIAVDAYTGDKRGLHIPERLTTPTFFADARARLTDRGVLIYNVTAPSRVRRTIRAAIAASFRDQYVADLDDLTQVFLARQTATESREQVAGRAQSPALRKCFNDLRPVSATK